jgi:hypothetical protein
MKRELFRIFNVLMAVVVLLSSTGFGLVEHSCKMRGKVVSRIGSEQKTCAGCPSVKSDPVVTQTIIKKADCCEDEQRYENVDVSSSLSQLVAKFFKVVAEGVVAGVAMLVTALINWMFAVNESVAVHAANAPPSAYGRALLVFVQSFLI